MTIEAIYIEKLKPQLNTGDGQVGIDIEVLVQMQNFRIFKFKN